MVLELLLLMIMVVTGILAWPGDRAAAALLALEGALWWYVDKLFEGPILILFTPYHGLCLADLVGLAAVVVAATCVLRNSDRGTSLLKSVGTGAATLVVAVRAKTGVPSGD
jgi:hypothetical protein